MYGSLAAAKHSLYCYDWRTCGNITPGHLICNDLSVVLICLKPHNYNFGSENMATRTSLITIKLQTRNRGEI